MNAAGKAHRAGTKLGYVVGSALAAALLAGCAGSGTLDRFSSAASGTERASTRNAGGGVAQAEKAVEQQPGDAALRASLAQAYMKAGRFESAITAFNDAMELGDRNPRTALSLALANIAIGRDGEALTVLDDWRAELPPVDAGLAYALAGQTGRGAAILSEAVRGGADTPQARQNFAYALALDGRWREARIMMSQDLTGDVINDRIGEWAALASAGHPRIRVAALLGTPMRTDSGQPARLALVMPASVQPAVETPAEVSSNVPQLASAELSIAGAVLADAASVADAMPAPVQAAPQFEAAFAHPGFVSVPVIQQAPAARPQRVAATRASAGGAQRRPAASSSTARAGTHLVQLGSFTSEEGARRAWGVYTSKNAALRNYRMTVIPVTVEGKSYWRLAAAGFDAGTARSMCGTIKSRGGTCLTYANTQAPSLNGRGGAQLARRR